MLGFHGYRFWSIGTEGTDAIYYQKMGIQWSQGVFELTCPGKPHPFFLPALFSMSGIFYKIFGLHDFTFKLQNLSSIAGIFCLLLLIARQLGLIFPYSLIPVSVFLLLPNVIAQSRIELAHVLSTFWVLLSFYLLNRFLKYRDKLSLVGSSAALHAAMMTHSELALLAPGYIAVLFIEKMLNRVPLKALLREAGIFSAVFFCPFLFYCWIWEPAQIIKAIQGVRSFALVVPEKHFPMLAIEFIAKGFPAHLGKPISIVLYGSLPFFAWRIYKGKDSGRDAFVLLPVFSYLLLFELLITRNRLEPLIRILIPLLPFLLFYLAGRIQSFCGHSSEWRKRAAFFFLICAIYFNFKELPVPPSLAFYSPRAAMPFYRYQTVYRHIYEKLKNRLAPGKKLLVAPSQFYKDYDAFNLPFYFNGKAVHLRDCTFSSRDFDTFLRKENVQFVFLGKERFFDDKWPQSGDLAAMPCLADSASYDAAVETNRLMEALKPLSPVVVYDEPHYGTVYEIHLS